MDDKTAEIPSLKKFKEQQEERKAHSDRSKSMQSKGQMKRSKERIKEEEDLSSSTPSPTRRPVPEKNSRTSDKRYAKKNLSASSGDKRKAPSHMGSTQIFPAAKGERYADSKNTPESFARRPVADREQVTEYERTSSRTAPPAPRTYARERIRQESEQTRRKKAPTPSPESDSRRRAGSENFEKNIQRNSQQSPKTKSQSRPQKTQKAQKPQKSKKPLSPAARKFRSIMGYVAIVAVVLSVGVVLSLTVLFKTEQINVTGNGQYSVQEIIGASGLHMGENIFTAPKGRAADKIEKVYPNIEKADVYLAFPNTINIDITMAKPACVIEALGGYYVLSGQGKVLEVASTTDEIDAPVIEGLEIQGRAPGEYIEYGSDIVSSALEEMFTAFSQLGTTEVTAINITSVNDGTIEFKYVYDDRIVVFIGIPEHITYKIQTAQTIISEKIDVNDGVIAGDLDVSMCYESKKSYFNEYTLLSPNLTPEPSTTAPTESTAPTETEAEGLE